MDFLNEFSKKFTSVARSVSEKSRENAETSRLNGELSAATNNLEKLYGRFGRACYAVHEGGGDHKELEQLALQIRAARLHVEELTARRDAAREMKRCLGCGAVFPREARFCSACGKRLPEAAPKPEPMELGEYCAGCGAKREGGEAICPVCGLPFDTPDDQEQEPEPAPEAASAASLEAQDVEEPARDEDDSWNQ